MSNINNVNINNDTTINNNSMHRIVFNQYIKLLKKSNVCGIRIMFIIMLVWNIAYSN